MNSFKQALILLKANPKESLLLGLVATCFVFLVRYVPYISALVISFGVLALQEFAQKWIETKTWSQDLHALKKGVLPYLIVSFVLLPTSVLLGSALGVMESPQGIFYNFLLSWGLMILAVYFYFVLSQALRFHLEGNDGLAKAIDRVGLASFRHFKNYFVLSFYFSFLILLSEMIKGVGLLVTLPLLFFTNHYLYLEMKSRFSETRVQP